MKLSANSRADPNRSRGNRTGVHNTLDHKNKMKKNIWLLAAALLAASCANLPKEGQNAVASGLERLYCTDVHTEGRTMYIFDAEGRGLVGVGTAEPNDMPVRDYPNGFPEGWTRCDFPWIQTNSPTALLAPVQWAILESDIEPAAWVGGFGSNTLSVLLRGRPRELASVIDEYFLRYCGCRTNYHPVSVMNYASTIHDLRRGGTVSKDVLKRVFPDD